MLMTLQLEAARLRPDSNSLLAYSYSVSAITQRYKICLFLDQHSITSMNHITMLHKISSGRLTGQGHFREKYILLTLAAQLGSNTPAASSFCFAATLFALPGRRLGQGLLCFYQIHHAIIPPSNKSPASLNSKRSSLGICWMPMCNGRAVWVQR